MASAQSSPEEPVELKAELRRLQRRNAELEVLYDTIRDLTSSLSVHRVLQRLLERALGHLGAEIGSILLLHGDTRLRIAASRGLPEEIASGAGIEIGDGISGWVFKNGESLLVRDVELDDRFRRRNNERYYTHSFISAPIVHQRSVRGVINVNNKRSREAFDLSDLQLLEALAGHASVALANAHEYEKVLESARRDALTGLSDHGHFWETMQLERDRALRHTRPLSVVLFDIDHFKGVNDRHGHLAGDRALCAVARRIELNSRLHDTVARYGGEEFAVILPETDLEGAAVFGEKIRVAVGERRFGPKGQEPLTLSAGIACLEPGDQRGPRALVEQADARLYRAKQRGRDQVCRDDGTA